MARVEPIKRRTGRTARSSYRALKAILAAAFVVFSLYYFSQSPFFALEQFKVSGLRHLSSNQVTGESGLIQGMNIFQLNLGQAEQRLLSDPWIQSAAINLQLPHTVQIAIVERQPSAMIYANQHWLLLDREGICIDSVDNLYFYSLPIISGLNPDTCQPGKQVSANPVLQLVLTALDPGVEDFFSEVNISQPDDLVAYTRDSIPVYLGKCEDLHSKLALAQSLLTNFKDRGSVSYVDLRSLQAPAIKYTGVNSQSQENLFIGD